MSELVQKRSISTSADQRTRASDSTVLGQPDGKNIRFERGGRKRYRRLLGSIKYYALGLYHNVGEDNCFLFAAGVAFNVLLSIIPISLLLVETISLVLKKNANAANILMRYLTASIPDAYKDYVSGRLIDLLGKLTHIDHWAGIIGGVSLLWLGSALFSTLRSTLNSILRLKATSNSVLLKLLDLLMMVIIMALFIVVHFIWLIPKIVISIGQRFFSQDIVSLMQSTLTKALSNILPFAVLLFIYYMLFRVLPYQRLPRKVILVATFTNVILLTIVKYVFAYYTLRMSSINVLYGAYALIFGAVLWLYYVSFVFTIGAEVGRLYWDRDRQVNAAALPASSA